MNLHLGDILDLPQLQSIFSSFWSANRIPMGLIDADGQVQVYVGWQQICTEYHLKHPAVADRCLLERLRQVSSEKTTRNDRQPIEMRCASGLIDLAQPLFSAEKLLGYFFLGQFLPSPPDLQLFRQQALRFGFEPEAYLKMVAEVPVIPLATAVRYCDAFLNILQMLSACNLDRQQAEQARQEIESAEQTFQELFAQASEAMGIWDFSGRFLEVNQPVCDLLESSREHILGLNLQDLAPGCSKREMQERLREIIDQGRGSLETELVTRTRIRIPVEIRCRLVRFFRQQAVLGNIHDLREQQEAELRRRATEKRFRLIFEKAAVGIITTRPRGRIFEVNPQFCNFLGYSAEELAGMSILDITAPEDRPKTKVLIDEASHGITQVVDAEKRYLRKDGSEVWGRVVANYLGPETDTEINSVAMIQDISRRKQAEDQLVEAMRNAQQARAQVTAILRSALDAMIVTNLAGRIVLVNQAAEKLLGQSSAKLCDCQLEQLIADQELLERVAASLAGAESAAPFDLTGWNRAGPEEQTLEARVTQIAGSGETGSGALITLRDVTRERQLDRLKDEFISTAAHELRTPMTSILGYTELLLEQYGQFDNRTMHEFLTIIFERSTTLATIIGDMLDLSRVQSGRLISLDMQIGNLNDLLRQSVVPYRAAGDQHTFQVQIVRETPPLIFDSNKISQVLDNLISNAVKFSPDGGTIRVKAEFGDQDVLVTVADEGVGMTPEQVERVFDKFYRADSSTTSVTGLGLGMSLVKMIIEAHGGEIRVKSEPGEGTTVSFTLPIQAGGQPGNS